MKIIINENQIINLIKERTIRLGGDETYSGRNYDEFLVNKLLEKIKATGIESLTPKEKDTLMKMSRGEPIDMEEPQEEIPYESGDVDIIEPSKKESGKILMYTMFIAYLPHNINIGDENWSFYLMDENVEESPIIATNLADLEFAIAPFLDKKTIQFGKLDTNPKYYFTPPNIPQNEEEMKSLVKIFFNEIFPAIVKEMKKLK